MAQAVFDIIVSPEAGLQNVTEWCKKELCWTCASRLELPVRSELFRELIDRNEDVQQKKDSEAGQKLEVGIEKQTIVFQLGSSYWKKLREWGSRDGLLSPDDLSILTVAVAMPRKLPTEKQSSRLIEIKTRLESEGYPVQVTGEEP